MLEVNVTLGQTLMWDWDRHYVYFNARHYMKHQQHIGTNIMLK